MADVISQQINDAVSNSQIDKQAITNIVGYTGFSILVTQNVPAILTVMEPYFDNLNIDLGRTQTSSMVIQCIAGTIILIYGILENNSVIYLTIPAIVFLNVVALGIKLYFVIKEKRNNIYY